MRTKDKTDPILCASCGRPMRMEKRTDYDCMAEKPCRVYAFVCTRCSMRTPPVSTTGRGWSDRKAKRVAHYLARRLYNLARDGAAVRNRVYLWAQV
jgi:hypothetical protein